MTLQTAFTFRFADVEVCEEELRVFRSGEPLAIEPKAFRVLIYLLRHAGRLVAKEELLTAVWGDVAVTENSLSRAVALLRRLLEDDPHCPRFIETVSNAGYRFICPVETGPVAKFASRPSSPGPSQFVAAGAQPAVTIGPEEKSRTRLVAGLSIAAFGAAAMALFALWRLSQPLPPPHIGDYVQLTRDGRLKSLAGTDGVSLYLNEQEGSRIANPAKVSVNGGEVTPLPIELPNQNPLYHAQLIPGGISPDGTRMLVLGGTGCWDCDDNDLWVVETSGSPARYLAKAWYAGWSRDGRQVVFARKNGDLFTIAVEGGIPKLLLAAPKNGASNLVDSLNWSPDGRRIWFVRFPEQSLWEISADGSNLHRVLPGWDESHYVCCGHWTRDGQFFLFSAGPRSASNAALLQLWLLDERRAWLRPKITEPIQLAGGPAGWGVPFPSPDGKKIFSVAMTLRGELERFDKQSKQFLPLLGGISAEFLEFSKDGRYLAYVTFPDGILWRSNLDGTGPVQLTSPPFHPLSAHWSPDGQQILFKDLAPNKRFAFYVVSSQGGSPTRLFPNDADSECDGSWLPDGKSVFYETDCRAGGDMAPGKSEARIVNVASGEISVLPPGPKAGQSPRLSPDGRYIFFVGSPNPSAPMFFDMRTRRYTILHGIPPFKMLVFPVWSHDSKYVYFVLVLENSSGIYRVSIPDGKVEPIADLKDITQIGSAGRWLGLDPADSPLVLRNAGNMEIYALTLDR